MTTESPKPYPRAWPNDLTPDLHCPGLRIPEALHERLRNVREQQMADHLAGRPPVVCGLFYDSDVVILKNGLGRAAFLGLDGRVWIQNYGEGLAPEVVTDARDIASIIVRWSGDIEVPELVELLPSKPHGGYTCGVCDGTRWLPRSVAIHDDGRQLHCLRCHGLGWTLAERAAASDPPRDSDIGCS